MDSKVCDVSLCLIGSLQIVKNTEANLYQVNVHAQVLLQYSKQSDKSSRVCN